MTWETALILRIVGGSILAPIVFRFLGNAEPRERISRILIQYLWATVFAVALGYWWGFTPSNISWQVLLVGALMPLGVFFQWRSISLSVSRTAIFSEATSIIPLVLSAVFLGEWQVFVGNHMLVWGFALVMLGIGLNARHDIRAARKPGDAMGLPLAFYGNAIGFATVFALATFLQNYWAKAGVGTAGFLVSWYLGALLGSVVLFAATRHLARSPVTALSTGKEHTLIFLGAISIVCSLGLQFVTFTLVAQTIALPIISVGGLVAPALVGILLFKEWKKIQGWVWVYFALAFVGALLMALSR